MVPITISEYPKKRGGAVWFLPGFLRPDLGFLGSSRTEKFEKERGFLSLLVSFERVLHVKPSSLVSFIDIVVKTTNTNRNEGFLLMVLGVIGLVGNTFSMALFARQRIQRVFHHLLLLLAIFDAAYIFCSLLLFALPMFIEDYIIKVKLNLLPYLLPIIHIALVGSIYSTVALAVERYITVCHPFVRFRSGYKSKAFIIPILIFSVGYTIPKFFELRLEDVPLNGSPKNGTQMDLTELNETSIIEEANEVALEYKTLLVPTSLRRNKIYIRVYLIWINLFAQIIIPFVLLVTLNYKIYSTIKKSETNLRNHLRVTANSTQEPNTNDTNKDNNGVSTSLLVVPNQASGSSSTSNRAGAPNNKATSLRKREVTLSKVSIYIVFVFLFCHSVRIIPNTYEMVFTYIQDDKSPLIFPQWVRRCTNLSHLLVTLASSVNFYIYYAKYGNFCGLRKRSSTNNVTSVNGGGGRANNTDTSFNLVIRSLDDSKRPGHTYTIRANLPNRRSMSPDRISGQTKSPSNSVDLPVRMPPDGQEANDKPET